jgi:hypothetical protein
MEDGDGNIWLQVDAYAGEDDIRGEVERLALQVDEGGKEG